MVAETTRFPGSSNLAEATYDPDVENLTVTFVSGETYLYMNVPPAIYRGLQNAGSAGAYFARQIRGRFSYERT